MQNKGIIKYSFLLVLLLFLLACKSEKNKHNQKEDENSRYNNTTKQMPYLVIKNGLYTYIDKNGKEITLKNYNDAGIFSDELAYVELDGKYGFVEMYGS